MSQHFTSSWVASWVTFCARHAKSVCLLFVILCGLLASYTVENLGINTKTTDMLSEKLGWRQTLLKHEESFPQLTDTLVAVVDAQTPAMAIDAREKNALIYLMKYTRPMGVIFFVNTGYCFLKQISLKN